MTSIVAISGAPGSGKSTLCRGLARALGDAAVVHMDHYEQMTAQPLQAIARWMESGARIDELPLPGLSEHLDALKQGRAVTDPATGEIIRPAKWLVFETQFGRAHLGTGRHIDMLIWLDTPLDISLARKLMTIGASAPPGEGRDAAQLAWMKGYLDSYLSLVWRLLRMQQDRVVPRADIVLDGTGEPALLVSQALDRIVAHR
jgi:energy-coupling factor transporter ATP-binding protein EcfA2